MKRNTLEKMIFWMNAGHNKPLWISGAPQVGKTYMALEFAKMFYDGYFYFNIRNDALFRTELKKHLASGATEVDSFIAAYNQIPMDWLNKFIIIFDDFYDDHELVKGIKEIFDNRSVNGNSYVFIARNNPPENMSNLFEQICLFPMEFDEYLSANGSEWYVEVIRGHYENHKKVPGIVHKEMLNLFQDYLKTGGMPEAVSDYMTTGRFDNIPSIQRKINILNSVAVNEVAGEQKTKALQLLEVYPEQLLKNNKKFQYTKIRKGVTHTMYSDALTLLEDLQLVNRICRGDIDEDGRVLLHNNQFRLYSNDFGLLNSIFNSSIPTATIYDEEFDDDINPYGQLLLENYFLQHCKSTNQKTYFWESGSIAQIDFINETEAGPIPVEVRYLNNNRSKSLSVLKNKYKIPYSIKLSSSNFDSNDTIKTIPYYSIFCM